MELLLVLAIIGVLSGLSYAGAQVVIENGRKTKTAALLKTIDGAIANYAISVDAGLYLPRPQPSIKRIWDVDGDGLLDGDPRLIFAGDGATKDALVEIGYFGFVRTTQFPVSGSEFDKATGRIRDPWGTPIRMRYRAASPGPYGGQVYGLWSCGRDRKTEEKQPDQNYDPAAAANRDDIVNWK